MNMSEVSGRSASVFQLDEVGRRRENAAPDSARSAPLVFVTGATRSGKSTLSRFLGAHSVILSFNRLDFFDSFYPDPTAADNCTERELGELAATLLARQNNGLWGTTPTAVEHAWGRQLASNLLPQDSNPAGLYAAAMTRLTEDAGKTFACDPSPRNILHAERLLKLYPNAKFIHMVRDPRAVIASQKRRARLIGVTSDYATLSERIRRNVSYHPYTMSRLWAKTAERAMHLIGHPRFLAVRFEDLIANPDAVVRRICNFLGLSFEPEMIDKPRWAMSTEADHYVVSSQAETTDWRRTLSRSEALTCEKITHRMMQRFGYPLEYLGYHGALAALPSIISYPVHVAGTIALNPVAAITHLRESRSHQGNP